MQNKINKLIEEIKFDYKGWHERSAFVQRGPDVSKRRDEMIEKFNNSFKISEGKKYIKIITDNGVWGFIVNVDNDKKFRKGDILKAAGYNTPARNFARGNLFNMYIVQWAGA